MGDWKDLAAGFAQDTLARRRESSLAPAFGQVLAEAKKMGMAKKEIDWKEQATMRATTHEYGLKGGLAKQEAEASSTSTIMKALIENYPSVAAAIGKQLGIDISSSATEAPPGMRPETTKIGPTTYKAPEQIDAAFMIKEYGKYRTAVEQTNAFTKNKVQIPGYTEWVKTNFPEYATEVLRAPKSTKSNREFTAEELSALGTKPDGNAITQADLEYTAQQEGMSVDDLYKALLQMKQEQQK